MMLLGWICIGCQRAYEPVAWGWPKPPPSCESCGSNVFQRIERLGGSDDLYPEREELRKEEEAPPPIAEEPEIFWSVKKPDSDGIDYPSMINPKFDWTVE